MTIGKKNTARSSLELGHVSIAAEGCVGNSKGVLRHVCGAAGPIAHAQIEVLKRILCGLSHSTNSFGRSHRSTGAIDYAYRPFSFFRPHRQRIFCLSPDRHFAFM
jgi:hypothetical protein